MNKKATKRISVCAALALAFAMLLTALVFVTGSKKTRAFADDPQGKLLYIVDAGRVNGSDGKNQLPYGYDSSQTLNYRNTPDTFVKRNGGKFTDTTDTEFEGKILSVLDNSYVDHPFAADPKTHKNWGYTDNYSEDMPHRIGRGGEFAAGYSEFRSVNDGTTTSERLVYKFEVANANALDVTVVTRSPLNWGTINGKMSVNDGGAIPLVADDSDKTQAVPDCRGVLNSTDNKYYLTLTFGVDGAQTVVCGIIIREKIQYGNIVYNLNGGTNNAANPATYPQGFGLTLSDPTRTGYTFEGWYDAETGGNKMTEISKTQTGDVTLHARWNVATYTITYNLDGGANDAANTATYTYGVGLTLAAPTREGYTFDGWYTAETGGTKVTTISNKQTGDITLYARWTQPVAPGKDDTTKTGCNSSIGGTASLAFGLLLLSAGAIVVYKGKKKN